jgi:hypothetical protein
MFATDANRKRRVVFTKHALQRAKENFLDINDLESLLWQSVLVQHPFNILVQKRVKWRKPPNPQYEFNKQIYFVVSYDQPGVALVITCGRKNKKRPQKATLDSLPYRYYPDYTPENHQ